MRKRIGWFAFCLCISGIALADAPKSAVKHDDVHRFFKSFADALHKGDAKAVASHFAEKGRHVHRPSNLRTEGQAAIEQLYADVFRPGRVKSVDLALEDVRQITPDVAAVDATATVDRNEGPPVRTSLHALLAKRDGKWQLDSVEEDRPATGSQPFDALQALSWMIGDWQDEKGKLEVHTQCKWSADHNFIDRTYSVFEKGKKLHEGTQKIGFDAADGMIRSWSFESDGSFGQGYWTFDGERWTVKLSGRTAAGLNVAATQIITPLTADSYTTELISREVGGKLLPNGAVVKVVRVKPAK